MVERMLTSRAVHNGSLMKSETDRVDHAIVLPYATTRLLMAELVSTCAHQLGIGAAKRSQQQANTTLSSSELNDAGTASIP